MPSTLPSRAARKAPHEYDQFEQELLDFPAMLLPQLPVASKFCLEVTGIPMEVHCITARYAGGLESADGGSRGVFLDGPEFEAVALGVQAGRLSGAEFKGLCLLKLQDPGFRISEKVTLSGAHASDAERSANWPVGRVLAALGISMGGAQLLAAAPSVHPSRPPRRVPADGHAPAPGLDTAVAAGVAA